MKGKVALVTGASRGIGRATALLLAERGAEVIVNFVNNANAAEDTVRAIREHGGRAVAWPADVRQVDDVDRMVRHIDEQWGRLDILVSNAAMPFTMKSLDDMTWQEFQQKLNDELQAAFLMTKAVIPLMARHHAGRIVYVGSGLSKHTAPRMAAHGTAKAALTQFARYVATEYGPLGITANVVSPGLVRTEATAFQSPTFLEHVAQTTPLGRVAEPIDVARVIAMYVSDDSGFVTGTYIPVNGGAAME
ncbi:MAG: KR domain-containing protein [Sulfobacillus thermosulfidooxidans]|uniref:SDR family oxidoreductase n=1 Tax=Sulfobacillus TaxID=28033 RepID=UPI000CD20829|nr:SDR family oxidoreductase [Sulfobacillus sp. hq2]POB10675.1 short-chain dehydrogenase [Sulfobacillus sp. hq2]PSR37638.1 MAG: KR domain-containing protein [Sulfobacillus thermosulfidooxidans]